MEKEEEVERQKKAYSFITKRASDDRVESRIVGMLSL
jgi:hypothetical protein